MEVAEQAVELGMPVVEVADIGGLEGAALQLEGQHDVAGIERHHVFVQMPRIGQEFFGCVASRCATLSGTALLEESSLAMTAKALAAQAPQRKRRIAASAPECPVAIAELWCGPTGTAGGRR